jgi:AcrR family transcriptional regulator
VKPTPSPPSTGQRPGRQEAKSQAARDRICQAVTDCLVEIGYADTSINRIVERCGLSKGALQHHFPSKEDLMAATALWLLDKASFLQLRNVSQPAAERSIERELRRTWTRGANTDEFRALLEILVKMRSDSGLRSRLAPALRRWHEGSIARNRQGYRAVSGRDDDVELLTVLNLCVIRGLAIQQQYSDDPAFLEQVFDRWIELVSPLLEPKESGHGD